MKNLIYRSLIIVLFVCAAGCVQAQDDLQTFRANYERLQEIYSPDEPDAIWMADSLARTSEQPYKALYNYLVSIMLPKLRPFMGLKSDAHDIRDVMKWSQEEVYDNMFRYADTAFSQLFLRADSRRGFRVHDATRQHHLAAGHDADGCRPDESDRLPPLPL